MALDTLAIKCITEELKENLIGGRVEKVYQPERDEITLNIRSYNGAPKLTISASPTSPRIHFTSGSKSNPQTPPMFCMLMRKHLTSGKIINIQSYDKDRIITFDIESYNELGDLTVKHLVVEIMGRYSNIILTHEDMTIIDSIKHIDFTVSSVRQILPGGIYCMPPEQDKIPILSREIKDFQIQIPQGSVKIDKLLLAQVGGISPLTAREITYSIFGRCDVISDDVSDWDMVSQGVRSFHACRFMPCMIIERESGRILDFSAVDIKQYESLAQVKYYDSMSRLLEDFYRTKDSLERMKQKSADVVKLLQNNIAKNSKKLSVLKATLDDAKNKERHKKYGDLLMANIYNITSGVKETSVTDYYSESLEEIKIPLLPELSPSANAQRYYKLYNKAKTAEIEVATQMKNTKEELEYLESTLYLAQSAGTEQEISDIRRELADTGYIKARGSKSKKQTRELSKPHHYISSDGFDIYVGKNNTQNDKLTMRFANSSDIWFHTKKIHGSHVIIKLGIDKNVPDRTIKEAAALAAYYSKARESSRVPVDYTIVKNVKKPNGAKPGMVIYDSYNTIYVNPEILAEKEE